MDFTGISMIPAAAGAISGLFRGNQYDEQLAQQQRLQDQQIAGAKEMGRYNQEMALQMWKKTNYKAQKEQMEEAGLNPALMYGMGGGAGGTTQGGGTSMPSGGSVGDPNSGINAAASMAGMGMQMASMKLMEAQTEKTEAEAAKIAGTDTAESKARTTATEFNTQLQQAMKQDIIGIKAREHDIKELEASRENYMWEAFKATGWTKGDVQDPDNPINKAMKAGWEKAVTDAENAKKDGDVKAAQAAIEQFKARLTKQGLSPDTPWYAKIVGDFFEKVGINPMQIIADYFKK